MSDPKTASSRLAEPDGKPLVLADGARLRLRQWHRADRPLWQRAFDHLSATTRYRRFLTPTPALSERLTRDLTELDHHDHEAVIALDDATGEGVGLARYVRDAVRRDTAEVAVTVADDWQHRGVGGALLRALRDRAVAEGISSFTAYMLADNRPMMALLEELGPVRVTGRYGEAVEAEVGLTTPR